MTQQYENPWDDPEFWRKPDAPLEPNTFLWFVALDHKLATLIQSCIVQKDKNVIDLVLDMNAWVGPPKEMRFPWPKNSQAYVREALQESSAQIQPQRFELVIGDLPRPFEKWRRLEFNAIFTGAVDYQEVSGLPADLLQQMKSMLVPGTNETHAKYTAGFRLFVSDGIVKSGDWTITDGYLKPKQPPPPPPPKTFDDKVEDIGKAAWAVANFLVDGTVETVQNWNREVAKEEQEQKLMQKRQGSFESRKPLHQIYDEVYKVLQIPIGKHRWNVRADMANLEITARCAWTEAGMTNGPPEPREISATYVFQGRENGTTIKYDYMVPRAGIFTNQIIEITNKWIKSWAEAPAGPPHG